MTRPTTTCVVVATYADVALARATARTAQAASGGPCVVLDVDGHYRPVGDERVLPLLEAVVRLDLAEEATVAAATLDPADFAFYAGVLGASYVLGESAACAVVLGAGVHVLAELDSVLDDTSGIVVVPSCDARGVLRRPAPMAVQVRHPDRAGQFTLEARRADPLFNRSLYAIHDAEQVAILRALAADWRVAGAALDTFAIAVGATIEATSSVLLGAWHEVGATSVDAEGRVRVDGRILRAVDLTAFDASRPWLLESPPSAQPRVRLSEHPALAQVTAAEAVARLADGSHVDVSPPPRVGLDPALRTEARRGGAGGVPQLLGFGTGTDLRTWATSLIPDERAMPVARYLAAIRLSRPDLHRRFRSVPGADTPALAQWALKHAGRGQAHDPDLLILAAEATLAAGAVRQSPATLPASMGEGPSSPGVNLVGFLAGELGLGVSARLMDDALQSAGVPTSTYDISGDIASRQGAAYRQSSRVVHDTTLMCVNAVDTPAVVARLGALASRNRTIGMWYWELEEFPEEHAVGFQHVDEVWAATDFMRDAIAAKAGDVPVRTVTPPLPQASHDPGVVPERLGIPTDRPWFLFTFDFLSGAARKNPFGLVEAFRQAFADRPEEQRPVLVIKTINAAHDLANAERLGVQVGGRSDVLFLDTYLDNHERHVLVAHCTAYISLHRAEGLGLTVAEAMAWGRPVITTGYGGVMQFCHEDNAFLVGWERGVIAETAGPYQQGMTWAEPDLGHAAELMRLVVDDPGRAAAVGAQAARDIRDLHHPAAAGARMRQVLDQGDAEWRTRRTEPAGGLDADPVPDRGADVGDRVTLRQRARSVARRWRG